MNQNQPPQPLNTAIVMWGALSFSMLFYGLILYIQDKATNFSVPESYSLLDKMALGSSLLLFVTYFINENKIKPIDSMEKRFPYYIMCWALHETMVIWALAAVFQGSSMLIYVLNFSMALLGNILTFPKAPVSKH